MDRDELIEELSMLYSKGFLLGACAGAGDPADDTGSDDLGALADKIIEKMEVKPSWEMVDWMVRELADKEGDDV